MMAAATGRSRVSVTYSLGRLQSAGAIRLHRGRVEVLDEKMLLRLSRKEDASFVPYAREARKARRTDELSCGTV
jgi:hypothetical protein